MKLEDSLELVSIIMPAYNCEDYINRAIKSVQNQTYSNWELIIIDDCSVDKTYKIVEEISLVEKRLVCKRLEKNSGPAAARNKAIEMARGEYIAFLDSDDVWFANKLEKQIAYMKKHGYHFTCTEYTKIDEKDNDLGKKVSTFERRDYNLLLKNCPGNSTVIYCAKELGKFQIENIRKRNDYVMWLKVIKKSIYLYGIQEALSSHRVREGSVSSNKLSLIKYHWKVYRDIEKLSIRYSVYLVFYWIIIKAFKLR